MEHPILIPLSATRNNTTVKLLYYYYDEDEVSGSTRQLQRKPNIYNKGLHIFRYDQIRIKNSLRLSGLPYQKLNFRDNAD